MMHYQEDTPSFLTKDFRGGVSGIGSLPVLQSADFSASPISTSAVGSMLMLSPTAPPVFPLGFPIAGPVTNLGHGSDSQRVRIRHKAAILATNTHAEGRD